MKMFKALYRDRATYKEKEVTVYAIELREDGRTDFLVYADGYWQWDDSYYFTPTEDSNGSQTN